MWKYAILKLLGGLVVMAGGLMLVTTLAPHSQFKRFLDLSKPFEFSISYKTNDSYRVLHTFTRGRFVVVCAGAAVIAGAILLVRR